MRFQRNNCSILVVLLFGTISLLAQSKQPDIIIFLADDLGFADVGFNGSDIQTPNIDRIAKEGVVLDQFYACPVCSPSRAGLLTGRYPIRFGMQRSVIPPSREFGLPPEEETIAEMLAKAGYKHRAAVGKWHLGHREQKWLPLNQGFTYSVGCYNGAIDYFSLERDGELDWHKNGQPYLQKGYATDLIGDAAVDFVKAIPTDEAYFLYVPFTAPHSPFQAKAKDIAKYPNRKGKRQIYAAMVDCMDQNVGKILSAVEERGNIDNTFILFSSDNGGVRSVADNGNLRDWKFSPYQGGIRVVAAAKWTNGRVAGGNKITERLGYIDLLPTLAEIADYDVEPKLLDGKSMLAALRGNKTEDRSWFTYIDQSGEKIEHLALNRDEWKLVVRRNAPGNDVEENNIQLYNIRNDAEEKNDVSASNPQIVKMLLSEMNTFYKMKAQSQIPRYGNRDVLTGDIIPNWEPVE